MHTFLKEAKRKQKWTTGLPMEYFALCSEHFEASCFSKSVLIGTPVDFKRFYLEKGSVPSVYAKPKDSLDTDYPRNEGTLANRFFPRNVLCMFLWDPTVKRQYPKSTSPSKKNRFLFRLGRPIRNVLSIFQDQFVKGKGFLEVGTRSLAALATFRFDTRLIFMSWKTRMKPQ